MVFTLDVGDDGQILVGGCEVHHQRGRSHKSRPGLVRLPGEVLVERFDDGRQLELNDGELAVGGFMRSTP